MCSCDITGFAAAQKCCKFSDLAWICKSFERYCRRNSVNYPNCDMGICQAESRIAVLHLNIPNMIGQVTGTLAEQGVNISDMTNKSRDQYAYTLLDLEARPTPETIEKLKGIKGILRVREVK